MVLSKCPTRILYPRRAAPESFGLGCSSLFLMTDETQTKKIVDIATKQLVVSTDFKKPWMEEIKKFENAYYGREKETFRIQFKVPLPVLPGMVDTLKDAFDDMLALRYTEGHPADYRKVRKIQALWDREVKSLRPNARWDYKIRADKFLAILSGRGIQKTYAESFDKFRLNFDVVDYRYFHCEPKGGGLLSNHLFKGEEGIFRTKSQLIAGAKAGVYDREAVKRVLMSGQNKEHKEENENIYGEKLARFEAMGFSPENNNYVGEEIFNLCEWILTALGQQWYLLFDPSTMSAVRLQPLKEVFESNLDPYTSWATHEDPKVFWSKSYAKDFYVAHDTLRTLLSQEVTNRQKKNLSPKYFDPEMMDASRIDEAQYRHDALVPVKTFGGMRKIQEGIYQFEVKELGSATIDLSNWLNNEFRTWTGTQDINDQANAKTAANVVYSKLQSASKRLSHRARSFQEAYAEVGLRAYHGFVEHVSEPVAIKFLGTAGYDWDYLTREDLKLEGEIDPRVISISEEDELNVLGKDQKKKAVETIIANEVLLKESNPRKLSEVIYKDLGGWKDEEVSELLDVNAFESLSTKDKADVAILSLCRGKMPDLVYDADVAFAERIIRFEKDHRNSLAKKLETNQDGEIKIFFTYLQQHMPIIASNMGRLAGQIKAQTAIANSQNQNQKGEAMTPSGQAGNPSPAPAANNSGAAPVKMGAMQMGAQNNGSAPALG